MGYREMIGRLLAILALLYLYAVALELFSP